MNSLLARWQPHSKSTRMLASAKWVEKIEKFLSCVFHERSSVFYQAILGEVEKLVIGLRAVCQQELGESASLSDGECEILASEEK